MKKIFLPCAQQSLIVGLMAVMLLMAGSSARSQTDNYEFNDAHFHLTSNIQEGPSIHAFLKMMGNKAGRVALFGVPLQQQWSYRVDGDRAPTYYLHSDAPLYYYSFTDAWIAMAYVDSFLWRCHSKCHADKSESQRLFVPVQADQPS